MVVMSSNTSWIKRFFKRIKNVVLKMRSKTNSIQDLSTAAKNANRFKTGIQWQLDESYSEGPQYHHTVVYVDHAPNEVEHKNEMRKQEDLTKRITHYPPSHRLH